MRARTLLVVLSFAAVTLLGVVVGAACTSNSDEPVGTATPDPIVPTASVTMTPTSGGATSTPAPGEPRRTGVAELDAIIAAVESRDVATLSSLVEYQEIGCTFADGLGGPPKCEDGQAEGEIHRVFPVAACEGGWTRFATVELAQFAERARGVWGAFEVVVSPERYELPPVEQFIAFHSEMSGEDIAIYLEVNAGRIVRTALVCFGGIDDLVNHPQFELELIGERWDERVTREETAAPATGTPEVDAILAAVASYDAAALFDSARAGMERLGATTECVDEIVDHMQVECDPKNGEVPGDRVMAFPSAYCHGTLSRDAVMPVFAFLNGAPRLHSVVDARGVPAPPGPWPYGAYWLVYEFDGADAFPEAARLQVSDRGEVLWAWYGCGATAAELASWDGTALPVILGGD